MFAAMCSWIHRQFFQHKNPTWHNLSAVTDSSCVLKYFQILISTRTILQGNGMEAGRKEYALGPPPGLMGGFDNPMMLCLGHRDIRDYIWDVSDDFLAKVSSTFFELPQISFSFSWICDTALDLWMKQLRCSQVAGLACWADGWTG